MPRLKSIKIDDHDFMCSCGAFEKDAEGNAIRDENGELIPIAESEQQQRCRLVMEEVLRIANEGRPEGSRHETTRENLLSFVVYALEWRYSAYISGIHCDQWAAVSSQTYAFGEEKPEVSTYIQCDKVEDGVAATFLYYYQRFGEERDTSTDAAASS